MIAAKITTPQAITAIQYSFHRKSWLGKCVRLSPLFTPQAITAESRGLVSVYGHIWSVPIDCSDLYVEKEELLLIDLFVFQLEIAQRL